MKINQEDLQELLQAANDHQVYRVKNELTRSLSRDVLHLINASPVFFTEDSLKEFILVHKRTTEPVPEKVESELNVDSNLKVELPTSDASLVEEKLEEILTTLRPSEGERQISNAVPNEVLVLAIEEVSKKVQSLVKEFFEINERLADVEIYTTALRLEREENLETEV